MKCRTPNSPDSATATARHKKAGWLWLGRFGADSPLDSRPGSDAGRIDEPPGGPDPDATGRLGGGSIPASPPATGPRPTPGTESLVPAHSGGSGGPSGPAYDSR